MIQTQSSLNQSSPLTPSVPDKDSFASLSDDNEEYTEEENDDIHQDLSPEEEEAEDYPLVPDPKQEELKTENLLKRNQQILERKEQAKHHPVEPFNFLQTSEKDYISFKKLNRLPKPTSLVRLVCYIPEKNLLVILFQDEKTVKVYNTLNFKLVTVTTAQKSVKCMSYCKKLGRIIVGGFGEFLQLWSPKTFQVEAECLQAKSYQTIFSVAYIAKSNVIVAKCPDQIRIYNTGLIFMTSLSIPFSVSYGEMGDIFGLSKNLLLIFCHCFTRKAPILFNIKTGNVVDCSKTVFVPKTTCIEMTEKSPVNVFSCLGVFSSLTFGVGDDKYPFPLIQFTIDTKNEELVPVRNSKGSTKTFCKLNRIENSKYFLTEVSERYVWKTCLLSINKDKIEILRVVSKPFPIVLSKVNTYFMLKDGLSVVEVDDRNLITVYRGVIYREKFKKQLKDSS